MANLYTYIHKFKYIIIGVLIVLVLGLFFVFQSHTSQNKGLSYLNEQKSKDIEEIKTKLEERQKQEISEKMMSGELSIFNTFSDYLFLGDSRMEGFSSYQFVPSQNNLAKIGVSILSIDEDLPVIQERQPKNIYISFGVNDIESNLGLQDDGLHYDQMVQEQVDKILSVDPEATIYINSIIPIKEGTNDDMANKIVQYNEQLKSVCEKNGWIYIDNSYLISDPSLYANDGIHFAPSLYDDWALNMFLASYDYS